MAPEDWHNNNLVENIKDTLCIPKGTNIRPILEEILESKKKGVLYECDTNRFNAGHKSIVDTKSIEAQILANCLESGQSYCQALELMNLHWSENNQQLLSITVVEILVRELKPKICNIV